MSQLSYSTAKEAGTAGVINPVLAKLYATHGISESGLSDIPSAERAGLCDDVTYIIESSARATEREMAADILIALLRTAEKNLRQAIAERFALSDKAPLRVVLQFINDDIEVARPVLEKSKVLNDLDLLYIILSRDSPFWQAIANRADLTENVVETLVDTKDIPTNKTLLDNSTVFFSDYALSEIAKLSEVSPILSEALLARSSNEGGDFVRRIYSYASEHLKAAITAHCGGLSATAQAEIDDIVGEFTNPLESQLMPSQPMLKAADLFAQQGRLSVTLMINTLKRGQLASFIAQFSRFTELPIAVVVPMLQQKDGHSFAVVAKAFDIGRNDFLLLLEYSRHIMGDTHIPTNEIYAVLAYYDRITPDVAKRLMKTDTKNRSH